MFSQSSTLSIDYGGHLHVWMRNLSQAQLGHRRLWLVLEKEMELYEYTEFTGAADNWLRTFLRFQRDQGVPTTEENFTPRLKHFLKLEQHRQYRRLPSVNRQFSCVLTMKFKGYPLQR